MTHQCVIYNNGTKIVMKIVQPKLVESKVKRVIQILS